MLAKYIPGVNKLSKVPDLMKFTIKIILDEYDLIMEIERFN